ncbi:MAG: D-Ala-D-Ala carboxypeptidase family metallohydrolase [Sphingomicrobium sp.]
MHRFLAFILTFVILAPASAQYSPQPLGPPLLPVWNPAADYVTTGQDEPGYRNWYLATPRHAMQVAAFNRYLTTYEVGGIVPTWQLLRTASMWQRCAGPPFEIPPMMEWPNVVQTLRYIRDYVVPAVGPVEPVSAYRNPSLNACAGGAPQSSHQHFQAVDLVPLRPISREQLMRTVCTAHLRRGGPYQVGLGFYAFLRFHIDTTRFRKWGMADAGEASPCNVAVPRPAPPPSESVVLTAQEPAPPPVVAPNTPPPASDSAVGQPDPLAPR